jgi:hypothetical protein
MLKVVIYSGLLLAGLVLSQVLPAMLGEHAGAYGKVVQLCTMTCLAFIMIHVGIEFSIDKTRLRSYGWDYFVASIAAMLPWALCVGYFVFVILPRDAWGSWHVWRECTMASLFAAPTSAGVLFSMLAAAGLSATWIFGKARVLAIFDDLHTVLLMVPLKAAMVGMRWQLGVIVLVMVLLLALAYVKLHKVRLPSTWVWVLGYAAAMVAVIEGVYSGSKLIDPTMGIHIEVLLPAFALGCIMRTSHHEAAPGAHHDDPHAAGEARASFAISGVFMLLVGLSMPSIAGALGGSKTPSDAPLDPSVVGHALREYTPAMGWGEIAFHVAVVTILSNLGKMFPALCYRKEATLRERLALSLGMWPRGEVGAGVLVVSLGYGIVGPIVAIAMLCLALNLVLTGVFIVGIKKLLGISAGPIDPPTGPTRLA